METESVLENEKISLVAIMESGLIGRDSNKSWGLLEAIWRPELPWTD
jgi:hypothetical protein